ncbi:uncharacterized protein ABDE67_017388 isoform 2-T2 [Symphorus nematophorus]
MSVLERIKKQDPGAAKVLQEANLHTDSEICKLTREDLNELFSGHMNFKRRSNLYELIHKQNIDEVMRNLRDFIPRESLSAALTDNGVLVDYLHLLNDQKSQINNVLGFLNAQIDFLEHLRKDLPGSSSGKKDSDSVQTVNQPQKKPGSLSSTETSNKSVQTEDQPQDEQGECLTMLSTQKVIYRTIVSGKTLGADKQLMDKLLRDRSQDGVQFLESKDGDHQVTILFCPISSRSGSDIDAALTYVKDDKPVILVKMHHERQPRFITSGRTYTNVNKNVVMHVNVFYHDTVSGLITCKQNNDAVSDIQNKLLEYSTVRHKITSGNAHGVSAVQGQGAAQGLGAAQRLGAVQGQGAARGRTGSTAVGDGYNNSCYDRDSGGGVLSYFRFRS